MISKFLSGLVFMVCSYVVYGVVQREYYKYCTGNILQVIFFRNSTFCVLMYRITSFIEGMFSNFVGMLVAAV
jgi:hypothetical protein